MIKRVLPYVVVLLCASAFADDYVKVRYTIRNGGKVVDRTAEGVSSVMPVARMMAPWRAAIEQMKPGDKRTITVTSEESDGKIPPGQVFEIETELVEWIKGPETPAELKAPARAERSRSGLAWEVLKPGEGTTRPGRRSKVRVHYSGWTTDGRLFDSTILRGHPSEFRLDGVIAGWTEGVAMMTVGEARRFWIPARLAYAKSDGPQGDLVFDIELVEIVK